MKPSSSQKTKIVLNGLGRIGRVFLRIAYNNPNFEIVAAHSRSPLEMYAHLLKYDTTYGIWDKEVKAEGNTLVIDGVKIPYITDQGGKLPWGDLGVDVVLDATGNAAKREKAKKHLDDGAKFVLVTAPMDDADETFVYAANHQIFDPKIHKIISAASCTTVCSTLTLKVLEEKFGVRTGFINTIHAVTSDQSLLDGSHKDLRRARAAMESIIPTTTGVSKTIVKLYPHLKGKISALSLRVPVQNPSIVVLTAELNKATDLVTLNQAFSEAAAGSLKNHLGVSNLPLVSTDFRGNPNGAVIDLLANEVVDGKLVNVLAWYDNEWGYVTQMMNLLEYICKKVASRE